MFRVQRIAGRRLRDLKLLTLFIAFIGMGACTAVNTPTAPEAVVVGPDIPGASAPVLPASIGRQASVEICHSTPNRFVHLTVAEPAVRAHLQHGDGRVGDAVPGHTGMIFGADCGLVTVCVAAPGQPGFLGWTTAGFPSGSVQLFWEPGSGTIASYIVEVGTTIGGTDVAVIDTHSDATSYVLSGLQPSVDYYHARVRAKNLCGVSPPSNEANPRIR